MSDGRKLTARDLARVACATCEGCGECCRGMGDSILLDPWDVFHLTNGLGRSFEDLLSKEVDLVLGRGVILPHLSMKKQDETVSSGANGSGAISSNMSMKEEACAFLGEDGRCQIHAFRPGLCRLFPLGRQYHDGGFSYFVLPAACPGKTRTKVRISSYLDVPELPAYETFLLSWHDFLAKMRKKFSDTEAADFKEKCMVLLKVFYLLPYDGTKDFYLQYRRRLKKAETLLLV